MADSGEFTGGAGGGKARRYCDRSRRRACFPRDGCDPATLERRNLGARPVQIAAQGSALSRGDRDRPICPAKRHLELFWAGGTAVPDDWAFRHLEALDGAARASLLRVLSGVFHFLRVSLQRQAEFLRLEHLLVQCSGAATATGPPG